MLVVNSFMWNKPTLSILDNDPWYISHIAAFYDDTLASEG